MVLSSFVRALKQKMIESMEVLVPSLLASYRSRCSAFQVALLKFPVLIKISAFANVLAEFLSTDLGEINLFVP
jgi:hypothetical protein